jgi:hypothetical protein
MNAADDSTLELGRRGLAQSLKRVPGGAVGLDRSLFPLFTSGVGHERVLASFRAGITGAGGLPKVLSPLALWAEQSRRCRAIYENVLG